MPVPHRPDLYRHVVGLRAVRQFEPTAITDEEVTAILEAGRWTGSARNLQAWAFVVLRQQEDIARLAEAGGPNGPLTRATLAIALVRLPDGNEFDLGRVAQNMMLAAAARGIGSCPVTLHNQQLASEVLELPNDENVARRAVVFGYADDGAEADARADRRAAGRAGRKPLSVLVHSGRFGA